MNRRALALVTAIFLAACSGPASSDDTGAATWRVDSVPLLTLGADESDSLLSFGHVAGATRQSNGDIIVADRPTFSIRTYSSDGSYLRAFGREGSGPGEIGYLASLDQCGDLLYIKDILSQQYHIYETGGAFVRSIRIDTPEGQTVPYKSSCNDDGIFVHNGWESHATFAEGPGRRRGLVPYWLTGPDGMMLRQLDSFPGSERLIHEGGSGPHPLGKEPVLALTENRVYVGSADSLAITVLDLEGNRLATIAKPSIILATTPDDIARYKLLDTLGKSEDDRNWSMRNWERVEFPPTVPAYTALLIDHADNLWVRLFPRAPSATVRWLVFSPSGEEIGSLDLPMEMTVHEIGDDYILGSGVDLVDETPRVWLYRLFR